MTDGLKALAGDALHSYLMRFTKSPATGALTGALTTAVLQSSSVTTISAISFVSAGLLTFHEALGIIFGANLGTTITGWIVVLFGFKFKIGIFAFLFVILGVILRLILKGKISKLGYTIAGFGLIFVGISNMQEGMSTFHTFISFENLPADTLEGRIKLVLIGIVFTVITQASSAGVAASITALYTGLISFEQAAALVIGMDVGTTVKALIAIIGGSSTVVRTGISHNIYNIFTAILALFLITPFVYFFETLAPGFIQNNSEISLVAFHTLFNVLGLMIMLPFTYQFAKLIKTLIPQRGPNFIDGLDKRFLKEPTVALNAVQFSIHSELIVLLEHVNYILGDKSSKSANMEELQSALDHTHAYIDHIHLKSNKSANWERLISMIHIIDHMQRLHERCDEELDRAITAKESEELSKYCKSLIERNHKIIKNLEHKRWIKASMHAKKIRTDISGHVNHYRSDITTKIATGKIDIPHGTDYFEAIRWLNRVSNHIERIMYHYKNSIIEAGK